MKLEHANITVYSIEKSMKFLKTVFPEFEVRGKGTAGEGDNRRRWVHFGTDETYVALEELEVEPPNPKRRSYFHAGINHLGFEVENIDEIQKRLEAAGFTPLPAPKEQFRKRMYVHDNLGVEWELVEYFSKVPGEKNRYE